VRHPNSTPPARRRSRTVVGVHGFPPSDDLESGWGLAPRDQTDVVSKHPLQLLLGELLQRPIEFTQYAAIEFGRRCREAQVRPSMGSVGDCYDNALCESFFATLECELLDRVALRTPAEGRTAVFDFIEGWYNPTRRHSSLDYVSPIAFERQAGRPRSDDRTATESAA
jgi:putative transposase